MKEKHKQKLKSSFLAVANGMWSYELKRAMQREKKCTQYYIDSEWIHDKMIVWQKRNDRERMKERETMRTAIYQSVCWYLIPISIGTILTRYFSIRRFYRIHTQGNWVELQETAECVNRMKWNERRRKKNIERTISPMQSKEQC